MHEEEFKDKVMELAKANGINVKYMFFCMGEKKGKTSSRFEHANLLDMHIMLASLEREKQRLLQLIEHADKDKTSVTIESE